MGLRVVLRPETEADLLQAHDWYGQDSPELAAAFVDSFEATIGRIEAMPELYAVAFKNIRRGKLRKFPTSFITDCS
jgi:plasmid stabilization system protein ParE